MHSASDAADSEDDQDGGFVGIVDPSALGSESAMLAAQWSYLLIGCAGLAQAAIALGLAFSLAREPSSSAFPYSRGKIEYSAALKSPLACHPRVSSHAWAIFEARARNTFE